MLANKMVLPMIEPKRLDLDWQIAASSVDIVDNFDFDNEMTVDDMID